MLAHLMQCCSRGRQSATCFQTLCDAHTDSAHQIASAIVVVVEEAATLAGGASGCIRSSPPPLRGCLPAQHQHLHVGFMFMAVLHMTLRRQFSKHAQHGCVAISSGVGLCYAAAG
jgi:chitodextrinase